MTHSLLARLDFERRQLVRPGEVLETLPEVTRLCIGEHRCISWSALAPQNADAIIEREIAHHRALGAAFEWKVYAHDPPGDLHAKLAEHGFVVEPREAVMVCELANLAAWLRDPPAHRVVRVSTSEELEDFRTVLRDAYGDGRDATFNELAAAVRAGTTGLAGYVAYIDGQPASAARLYTDPQSWFGGLYGGTTRAAFRGRGLYRTLVAARARDAAQLGARWLIVDALPTSQPILARLGFSHLSDTWPCHFAP